MPIDQQGAPEEGAPEALNINSPTWRRIYMGFVRALEHVKNSPRKREYDLESEAMHTHLFMLANAFNNMIIDLHKIAEDEEERIITESRTTGISYRPLSTVPLTKEEAEVAQQDAKKIALVRLNGVIDEAMLSAGALPPRPPAGFEEYFYGLMQMIDGALKTMQQDSQEMFGIFFEKETHTAESQNVATPKQEKKQSWWRTLLDNGFSGEFMKKKESTPPTKEQQNEEKALIATEKIINGLEKRIQEAEKKEAQQRKEETAHLDGLLASYLADADAIFPPEGYVLADDPKRIGGIEATNIYNEYSMVLNTLRRRLVTILEKAGVDISFFNLFNKTHGVK